MRQLKKLLLVVTPIGAAALATGGGTFSSFSDLMAWAGAPAHTPVAPSQTPRSQAPVWRTKKLLVALLLIGLAAYFGFGSTYANFQAETSNNGGSISSGTLTMSNTVNSNSACFSYSATSTDNINNGCDAAFAATNVAPGVFASSQVAKIVVANNGSIDGTSLYLYASSTNGKLLTPITSGNAVTTITLTSTNPKGMEGAVSNGDSVVISYGGHSQTFAVTSATPAANSNGGATSISVTSQNALYNFPAGSTVIDSSSNTTASNTDCYDTQTSQYNFNPIAGNPFCGAVLMYVQEVTGGNTYCWFGKGSVWSTGSSHTEDPNGRCVAPINATVSSPGLAATVTSIPISGTLNGNVSSGDSIVVTQGNVSQTFTASSAATFGATSISVNSLALSGSFTSSAIGATVTDTTAQTSLDANATSDSITNFDTGHRLGAGRIELDPVISNGNLNTSVSRGPELVHGTSRTFYVGLYLPNPGGANQNTLQGLTSTFGLTWHMDQ